MTPASNLPSLAAPSRPRLPRSLSAAFLLSCSLLLTACGSRLPPETVVQAQTIKLRPPVELLRPCPPDPEPPPADVLAKDDGDAYAEWQLAMLDVSLCREARLEGIRNWSAAP